MKSGWKEVKLGEVAEVESGGTPSTKNNEYWDGGNIFWVTLLDQKNKYIYDTQRKITELGLKKSSAKLLPKNTVIFSSRATIGEISIIKEDMATNQGSKNFICDSEKINYEFLYYLLKANVEKIRHISSGATYKEINKTVFSNFQVKIPKDTKEQQKIATILSNYDDLIENNEKRIKILENISKLIYEEWFVRFKFPEHEKVNLVDSKTEFGMIPERWVVKPLSDITDYNKGLGYKGTNVVEEGGACFVNLKSFNRGGGFRYEGLKRYDGDFKERHLIEEGDVIMAVTDMTQNREIVGRVARVPALNESQIILSMDLIKLIPKEKINKDWLYSFFRFSNIGNEIKHYANGANVLHLDPKVVLEQKLILPNKELRDKFAEDALKIFTIIDNLELKNQNLRKTRDHLLPKLISGEIDVSDLDIQLNQELANT